MTVLSVYNIKGGVGKTATAVNLSYLAANEDKSTLLCDLDPQSSATYYFRIKPKMKTGLKPLVKGKKSLEKNIKGTDYNCLDLLPADFSRVPADDRDRSLGRHRQAAHRRRRENQDPHSSRPDLLPQPPGLRR